MKQTVSEFDKEYEKAERKKLALIASGVIVFLSFCVLILYLSLPEHMPGTENIHGYIASETTIDTENGSSPAVSIKLENGREVTLLIKDGLVFKQDAKISLKKVTSTAGKDSYQFINYVQ